MDNIKEICNFFNKYPTSYLEILSGLLLLLFCILYLKTLIKYDIYLVVYSVSVFIYEISANYLAIKGQNNHIIFLIFFLLETILFSFFYFNKIVNKKFRIIIVLLAVLSSFFFIKNIISGQNMDDVSGTVQSLSFIVMSLLCYYYILSSLAIKKLTNSPLFWINSGVFIYFSGKFFVSLYLTKVLSASDLSLSYIWDIMSFMLIIFRVFLSIGFFNTKHSVQ